MSRVRVACFSLSLDGFGAGPNQTQENPLGERGTDVHRWFFPTRTFQRMVIGEDCGETGVDDAYAEQSFENVGAWVMGRNMFGPVRGPWPDDSWKGWWGDTPPYHCDVFVLTHHPRDSFTMDGGTTFHFVTDGALVALERARASAGEKDVRIGGGVATVRQYLEAGLIDEMHLAISPVILGRGEHLTKGLDLAALGFAVAEHTPTERATHIVLRKG